MNTMHGSLKNVIGACIDVDFRLIDDNKDGKLTLRTYKIELVKPIPGSSVSTGKSKLVFTWPPTQ